MKARITKIAQPPDGYVEYATLNVFEVDEAGTETHIVTVAITAIAVEMITGEAPKVGQVFRFALELEGV